MNIDTKGKTILKRGSVDWWFALTLNEAASRYRKHNNLPQNSSVEIDMEQVDAIRVEWNRNLLKRLWLLITNGNIHNRIRFGRRSEIREE